MQPHADEHDVVVIGAGPVGVTAAVLLAADGVDVLVVERRAGPSDEPKAISLDDESLRTYQRAGVEAEILRVIVPGTGTAYYDSDDRLLFHGRAEIPARLGYPFKNPFAQPDLERVLTSLVDGSPTAEVRFGTTVEGLDQDDTAVRVRLAGPDGSSIVRSRYVLAADGGRSTVRSLLGTTMTGRGHDEVWLVVDAVGDTRTERYGMHHGDPRRPHVVVPGRAGRCRYEFFLSPGEAEPGDAVPFALIERLLAPYRTIAPTQVERAVAYRFHGLSADRWREGRVFLLGDAAHMMPPFAGQGLNSGIRDAANLSWKIAAAVEGRGSEPLLDSYEAERKPHADAVIRSSERLGRIVMTRSARLAASRDAAIRRALATPTGRAYLEGMQYRPAARLRTGVVGAPRAHPLVGTLIGQPTVFSTATHRMELLDRVTGAGWSLLGVGVPADGWAFAPSALPVLRPRLVSVPLDDTLEPVADDVVSAVDVDTRLYSELESARGHFVLLRPDRFVAAVVPPARLPDLDAALDTWFGRRPTPVG